VWRACVRVRWCVCRGRVPCVRVLHTLESKPMPSALLRGSPRNLRMETLKSGRLKGMLGRSAIASTVLVVSSLLV
jgi:hypothetical protein